MTGCGAPTSNDVVADAKTESVDITSLKAHGIDVTDCLVTNFNEVYPLWSDENVSGFVDETVPKTKEVVVLGETYVGTYEETSVHTYRPYLEHAYSFKICRKSYLQNEPFG